MRPQDDNNSGSAEDRPDMVMELGHLEQMLNDLRVEFELYFSGVTPRQPDASHAEVKKVIRTLMQAPFRSSAHNFKLRSLRNRYSSLNTYWQRVLKEREEGRYSRDLFKVHLHEKMHRDIAHANSAAGQTQKQFKGLFDAYCTALEKQSGTKASLSYEAFEHSLIQRGKDLAQKNPGKKISFLIESREGKVSLKAKLQE